MRQCPRCGVAGAQLLDPDGSRQNSIANFPTLATELLNKSLLRLVFPRRFPGKEHHYPEPVQVESVVGAFFLTRRTVWQQIGGLDERFFFFFEETDFCLRVREQGWEVLHLPSVQVCHEQGKSARQWSAAARIEYWRSRYAYFAKNHPPNMALVTFGLSERYREKLRLRWAVARWHLSGCPAGMGLPR
jgi:GT2 family glycosyltransferase